MTDLKVFDFAKALERTGNDKEFFDDLVTIFFEEFSFQLFAMREAVQTSNTDQLHSVAHSIKSALASLGAMRASSISLELEKIGKIGKPSLLTTELIDMLEREVLAFKAAYERLRKGET